MAATLFEKICSGEIPADIVYQDDLCVCFRDISPQAPEHLLLVPRKPIPRLSEAGEEDAALLGHMMLAVGRIARTLHLDEGGFRLVINNGHDAGKLSPICTCICWQAASWNGLPVRPERIRALPERGTDVSFSMNGAALPACQALSMPVRYTHEKIAGRTGELAGGREKIQR